MGAEAHLRDEMPRMQLRLTGAAPVRVYVYYIYIIYKHPPLAVGCSV